MCTLVDPTVTVNPGWKRTCKNRIGKAAASTSVPGEESESRTAVARARWEDPPSVLTATGGHYSGGPNADAPPVAALGHGDRPVRECRPRASRRPCGGARAPPRSLRPVLPRRLRRRVLPGAPRPHRRGGDDQVRLPLHDDRAVGQAAPPLPPVDAAEDRRRGARLARPARARAVRRPALQRRRPHRAVPGRRSPADLVHSGGSRRGGARARWALRGARRLQLP